MPSRRARQYGCGGGLKRHHEFGVVCIATSDLAGLSEATPVVATIKGAPPPGTAVQPPMVRGNFLVLSGRHQQRSSQNGSGNLVRRHPAARARSIRSIESTGHGRNYWGSGYSSARHCPPLCRCRRKLIASGAGTTRLCRRHGLRQPGDLYDTCIGSLKKTLSALDQARRIAADRRACTQEKLRPGTPAFAVCLVNREQSPTGADAYGASGAGH
jgi:hypothetical protein